MPDLLSNLASAIVGAVIGAIGSQLVNKRADSRQRAATNRSTAINLSTVTDAIRRELGKRKSRVSAGAGTFGVPVIHESARSLVHESAHINAQLPRLFADLDRGLHNLAAYDRELARWGQIRAFTIPPGGTIRQPEGDEAAMWGEYWETRETCFVLLDSIDALLKPALP